MTGADILALTLRAEAGSKPVRAIEALAALAVNRARLAAADATAAARYAPGAAPGLGLAPMLALVCRAPFLFGCWMPKHPRRKALLNAMLSGEADAALETCRRVAARAAAGVLGDPTGGATHWHLAEELPGWAVGLVPTAEIGGFIFYRLPAG
ncbi:cell wall hydrolase [Siccirubricoccus phaeus]|uniref:cell wall hydrolase n=1 Tax=Siccirubricoccus phaeus TaxID=2595053 RepID=UPI0011F1B73A|nr:cell wall hydrolase [Siccirubricoccus phaeus]